MQTAIVTGASSGIGKAVAQRLLLDGWRVLGVGRDSAALETIGREAGPSFVPFQADVAADTAPAEIVRAAMRDGHALNGLVQAAGVIASGAVDATTDEAWDAMFAVNVRAPFRLLREAAPHLERARGAVVNVSSVTGLRAFPGLASYCSSKAALDHLTRAAALDFAPKGVRVNAVNPGVVVTNLHRRGGMDETKYAAFLEHSKTTHPLGRAGQASEVADLIAFLLSEKAGWITGETFAIDGGRHLTCAR
ncbi:MAG: SDR family oxidoreductase [Acidobacteriota bacterium]|nr:SDR family oxidoreductase [Acidobacteriota bacterium]